MRGERNMKNNRLLPFERNRYYAGKMLTSSDFMAEQTYMNNKRRFLNQVLYGSGIVCGLGVVSLDDLSILVESGVAIDDFGREIVVDSSVVKKLSTIEGFEEIQTDEIILGLKYNEEDVYSVYAVNQQEYGREFEYNRVQEGYQLFVRDSVDEPEEIALEDEFYSQSMIYENDDYQIIAVAPANASVSTFMKMTIRINKLSDSLIPLSFKGVIQLPNFSTIEGKHEIEVEIPNIKLGIGEKLEKDFWICASDTPNENAEIVIQNKTIELIVGDKRVDKVFAAPIKVTISPKTYQELVTRELGKPSLDMRNISVSKDYVILAKIKLTITETAYLIEKIQDTAKNYIAIPAEEKKKNEYLACYEKSSKLYEINGKTEENKVVEPVRMGNDTEPQIASGTLEIALGDHVKKGDIRYSGEIMHGLGQGDVFISIGYEYIQDETSFGANTRSTYYGDPALFQENKEMENVSTAVKVLNDKGSFVVAAKILKPINQLILTYRWTAIKLPKRNDENLFDGYKNKSISAFTPTVTLGTKESYYFEVVFHNMEACSIGYELTEQGSGEITADGVYTAPNKEGVYEIKIYCTDMPIICSYAYAIVKMAGEIEKEKE